MSEEEVEAGGEVDEAAEVVRDDGADEAEVGDEGQDTDDEDARSNKGAAPESWLIIDSVEIVPNKTHWYEECGTNEEL